ncbi:hypothetical protein E2C01_085974 [Portunus trituberculatus]|uniref:Uncharacterized protein n=1 Tax=Portunus trituberculatus TaxID=210409 RepID=A0A5B7JAB5_PORTR|nr:hypothetical protein [Portunus trituberculatus]
MVPQPEQQAHQEPVHPGRGESVMRPSPVTTRQSQRDGFIHHSHSPSPVPSSSQPANPADLRPAASERSTQA